MEKGIILLTILLPIWSYAMENNTAQTEYYLQIQQIECPENVYPRSQYTHSIHQVKKPTQLRRGNYFIRSLHKDLHRELTLFYNDSTIKIQHNKDLQQNYEKIFNDVHQNKTLPLQQVIFLDEQQNIIGILDTIDIKIWKQNFRFEQTTNPKINEQKIDDAITKIKLHELTNNLSSNEQTMIQNIKNIEQKATQWISTALLTKLNTANPQKITDEINTYVQKLRDEIHKNLSSAEIQNILRKTTTVTGKIKNNPTTKWKPPYIITGCSLLLLGIFVFFYHNYFITNI